MFDQIGGLVASSSKSGRMSFAEPITGIAYHTGKYGLRHLSLNTIEDSLLYKMMTDFFHYLLGAGMGHDPPQLVSFPGGESGNSNGDLEHLLLKKYHPISFL